MLLHKDDLHNFSGHIALMREVENTAVESPDSATSIVWSTLSASPHWIEAIQQLTEAEQHWAKKGNAMRLDEEWMEAALEQNPTEKVSPTGKESENHEASGSDCWSNAVAFQTACEGISTIIKNMRAWIALPFRKDSSKNLSALVQSVLAKAIDVGQNMFASHHDGEEFATHLEEV